MKLNLAIPMFFVGCILFSCKRGDDFYINPNLPPAATPSTLLAVIEVQTMNTYEGELNRTASILIQHDVGIDGQATQQQVYSLVENQYDNQWAQIYQTLNNCKVMSDSFAKSYPYYAGISNILMAMNWGIATDLWGDIPFSEALQAQQNYFPHYDPQEKVINGIIILLDKAINQLSTDAKNNLRTPGSDDFIFNGDIDLWTKTAHTLKGRYMNRLSKKSNYAPSDILSELADGISSSSENCMAIHGGGANESNQWYAFLNARAYLVAGEPLVDSILKRPQDLRIYYYYDSTGLGGVVGSPVAVPDADASYWGSYLAGSAATSSPLVTYSEAKFIEAEVKVRQSNPNAFQSLNDAIMASAVEVTGGMYSGANIATYTAANTNLQRVMYEKWIAMFGQLEPYNDYRRTGLPSLTPNPEGITTVIPQRYPTPQGERVNNPNAPVPSLTTPVWFAQ